MSSTELLSGTALNRTVFRPYSPTERNRSDRSAGDRKRHRRKLYESIKENITDIIAEESIIGKDGDKIVKVPIRGVKEYRFVFGDNAGGVGTGDGESEPGQVVGSARGKSDKGQGPAGSDPGVDYYETEITLDELKRILFDDLELPDLQEKMRKSVEAMKRSKIQGIAKVGIPPRMHRYRTAKERKRGKIKDHVGHLASAISTAEYNLLEEGDRARYFWHKTEGWWILDSPMRRDQLRYKRVKEEPDESTNAVVICIMDTSGSMDRLKKYLARSFFNLLYTFLTTKYKAVEIVFIAHHTQAKVVTEDEFFHKGESGGTLISSGYKRAIDEIIQRYHPEHWNIYAFHCSDGDNFESDNEEALKAARQLCALCNYFGYGEIKPMGSHYYESSMLERFRKVQEENFQTVLIERREDIWPSFLAFLQQNPAHKKPGDRKGKKDA